MGIATPSTLAPQTRQLSDQNPLGTVLGVGPADLVGFYGISPGIVRPSISLGTGTLPQLITALGNLGLITVTA